MKSIISRLLALLFRPVLNEIRQTQAQQRHLSARLDQISEQIQATARGLAEAQGQLHHLLATSVQGIAGAQGELHHLLSTTGQGIAQSQGELHHLLASSAQGLAEAQVRTEGAVHGLRTDIAAEMEALRTAAAAGMDEAAEKVERIVLGVASLDR
ncbi:hypothetical protein [Azospirillum sp. TSO22-1]|uniref:hypothetical protein n=1 Tax=Azospirillum sp. TSO22-1 TaxID=716789 RepID=UPI000D61C78C|nr:hypothetical protein [Azospirillum sp. TSO22-1]PWC55358.1 hypothetical protein TSO221_05415 [Azospirillum sp. TSO22-1]